MATRTPALPLDQSLHDITTDIGRIPLRFPARIPWLIAFILSLALLTLFLASITYLFARGVGIWGLNIPVNWAFAIHLYVWWLGLGHAGTLISAMLLLMGQDWRNSLNRFAEAMTVCAVICAGMEPIIHLGRPWFLYWMFPYPATMGVWPQFRSPLEWDIWAVLTYLTVSIIFWYIGLVPDLATVRDRAKKRGWQLFFGIYAWSFWGAVIFNFIPLQGLWLRSVRRNPVLLFLIATSSVIGMWLERYMILVTSLYKDFLPSSFGHYTPTFWDWSTYIGMLGLFMTPFLLFVRYLPSISIFEDKEVLAREKEEAGRG
jgi:Ni/Fe-hydrogenase subunit HybB-like protein